MTGLTQVEEGMVQRLQSMANLPAVAWPNAPFTPGKDPYFRAFFLPGEPNAAGIGTAAMNEQRGVFQVSVYVPAGTGTKSLKTLCDAVEAHFKRGTDFIYGSVKITVTKAFRGPLLQEPDWASRPVSVAFQAFTEN